MSKADELTPPMGFDSAAPPDWPRGLRAFTPARVALERAGSSITTRHALEFSLAHAQARDAVHSALAVASLLAGLGDRKLAAIAVQSAARSRTEYLRRPELGRTLSAASAALLRAATAPQRPATLLSIILADGLSALATERHAVALLDELLKLLDATWSLAPIVVAEQARVALGDPIGTALHAEATVILIGERPGLSSPDSLGAYVTWGPRPGRTDAERNCVSNIRTDGLGYASAAAAIAGVLAGGRSLGVTGVALRPGGDSDQAPAPGLGIAIE